MTSSAVYYVVCASDSPICSQSIAPNILQYFKSRDNATKISITFFKDYRNLKKLENSKIIFILCSYSDGIHHRSIRRFQRKISKYNSPLNINFSILSFNALTESKILMNSLSSINAIKITDILIINEDNHIIFETLWNSFSSININIIHNTKEMVANDIIIDHDLHFLNLCICYATVNGNSRQICDEIYHNLVKILENSIICEPMSLNELICDPFRKSKLNKIKFFIFVISSTGDGEIPENGSKFLRMLSIKCSNSMDYFNHTRYSILGLGDSNYSQFNAAAITIEQHLQKLGAKKFYYTGLADDGTGLEDVVEPWTYGLNKEISRIWNKVIIENIEPSPLISISKPPMTPSLTITPSVIIKQNKTRSISINIPSSYPTIFSLLSSTTTHNISIHNHPPIYKFRITYLKKSQKKNTIHSNYRYDETFGAYADLNNVPNQRRGYTKNDCFSVSLSNAKYLTKFNNNYVDTITIHLELRLPRGYGYETGDILCILPSNPEWLVIKILNVLKYDPLQYIRIDRFIPIVNIHPLPHIPIERCIQIQDVFRYCIDIRSIPKSKKFLSQLAHYCTDENDKLLMVEFASNLNISSLKNTHGFFLLSLLERFPSCLPPLEFMLHSLTELKARQYSICSGHLQYPDSVHICFRVLKHDNCELQSQLDGICSSWLYSLCLDAGLLSSSSSVVMSEPKTGYKVHRNGEYQIYAYFKRSKFKLPADRNRNLIFIGPGTGVGVFRAFLQHRNQTSHKSYSSVMCTGSWRGLQMEYSSAVNKIPSTGDGSRCLLFFGCRYSEHDFLYENEWKSFLSKSVLSEMFCAFSRNQVKKIYVQDLLRENNEMITDLILNKNAIIYVCGDAKYMAKDVETAFVEILSLNSDMSLPNAVKYLKQMQSKGRYNQDIWNSIPNK